MLTLFFIMINFFLIKNYSFLEKIYNIKDFPDSNRKLHKIPTPLLGGLIIYINFFLLFLIGLFDNVLIENKIIFYNFFDYLFFFLISTLFFLLGVLDDKYHINPNLKYYHESHNLNVN